MRFRSLSPILVLALIDSVRVFGQEPQNPDIDPLALRVLRAATDSIQNAKSFSLRAVVAKERLGSNGQMITFFHESRITVFKPDKLRVDFDSKFQKISLYYNKGQAVLFTPEKNLYVDLALSLIMNRAALALAFAASSAFIAFAPAVLATSKPSANETLAGVRRPYSIGF